MKEGDFEATANGKPVWAWWSGDYNEVYVSITSDPDGEHDITDRVRIDHNNDYLNIWAEANNACLERLIDAAELMRDNLRDS